jgi:hypothetical protein
VRVAMHRFCVPVVNEGRTQKAGCGDEEEDIKKILSENVQSLDQCWTWFPDCSSPVAVGRRKCEAY